jgi:hypothetical protein
MFGWNPEGRSEVVDDDEVVEEEEEESSPVRISCTSFSTSLLKIALKRVRTP